MSSCECPRQTPKLAERGWPSAPMRMDAIRSASRKFRNPTPAESKLGTTRMTRASTSKRHKSCVWKVGWRFKGICRRHAQHMNLLSDRKPP